MSRHERRFEQSFEWTGTSSDPNDEQFGDTVSAASVGEGGDFDAVLVGEPYDGAVIGRKGAREGPSALREALAGVKTHHYENGPVTSVGDLGDVVGFDGAETVEDAQEIARDAAASVYESAEKTESAEIAALPVFLGGDNSLTFGNVAPLVAQGSVGVVNFDAHLDVREVSSSGPTSGTPYRQLFETGLDGYTCVGARHFETSTVYADSLREVGGDVVTAEDVGDDPLSAADRALDALGDVEHVYVSVDLDVLDASAAPGVSAPTPGGLTTRELFRTLRRVAGDGRIAGFEVVECAPPLDSGSRTVAAGARALAHFLSGYAANGGQHA